MTFGRIVRRNENNLAVVKRMYEAIEKGDLSVFTASVHPDYSWRIPGRSSWTRTFRGQANIQRDLLRPLINRFGGTYTAKLVSACSDGDVVIAEVEGHVRTKNGDLYDNQYCFLFKFEGGLIKEVVEYGDTDLQERVLGSYESALSALEHQERD